MRCRENRTLFGLSTTLHRPWFLFLTRLQSNGASTLPYSNALCMFACIVEPENMTCVIKVQNTRVTKVGTIQYFGNSREPPVLLPILLPKEIFASTTMSADLQ